MPRNLGLRIGVVAVVLAISLWYLYPPKQRINLGLYAVLGSPES